jgi:hypothetical protein
MKNKSRQPKSAAFLFTIPVLIAVLPIAVFSLLNVPVSAVWIYLHGIVSILSFPWGFFSILLIYLGLSVQSTRPDSLGSLSLLIYLGEFVGAYINGYLYFRYKAKHTKESETT